MAKLDICNSLNRFCHSSILGNAGEPLVPETRGGCQPDCCVDCCRIEQERFPEMSPQLHANADTTPPMQWGPHSKKTVFR